MKIAIGIINALVVIGLIYLTIEGRDTLEIKTEIEISAPPSKVWEIITDIDQWQEWSPIISASQGTVAIDSSLNITMISDEKGKDGPQYNPVITKLDEAKYFQWRAKMLTEFVFTNDKIFKLEKTNTGTKLTHIETIKGLMAPLFRGKMQEGAPPMLNSMNTALKELAEKQI